MESSNSESKWSLDIINGTPFVAFSELDLGLSRCDTGQGARFSTLTVLFLKDFMLFSFSDSKLFVCSLDLLLSLILALQFGGFSRSWGIGAEEIFRLCGQGFDRTSNCLI